jgi:uncharacterized damage-inducible protein DinB
MTQVQTLSEIFLKQWRNIRKLTYDYLDMLEPEHLSLTLPFPESKSLGYQFWCMVGAHESYLKKLEQGQWQGFASSLDQLETVTPQTIKAQMMKSDAAMAELVSSLDLQATLKNGQPGYEVVQRMIEHEMHHHGQLINFMFCHHLPIPPSWNEEWALAYDD